MRSRTRSILVLSFVVSLAAANVHARVVNDDQDPRSRGTRSPIVRVIKQIVKFIGIGKPQDDGGLPLPPKP